VVSGYGRQATIAAGNEEQVAHGTLGQGEPLGQDGGGDLDLGSSPERFPNGWCDCGGHGDLVWKHGRSFPTLVVCFTNNVVVSADFCRKR
jgi:hypothetical protein